jgi:small subunit ribosomal protein S15e
MEVPQLLDLSDAELLKLFAARQRRRFNRVVQTNSMPNHLIRRLRKARKIAGPNNRPDIVKTHLRNYIVVPEMVTSVVGVYNGKKFVQVEIKPDMIGHYLGEFSITYHPVQHGRSGVANQRFMPLQ